MSLKRAACLCLCAGAFACNAADKLVEAAAKKAAATDTIVQPEALPAVSAKDPHAAFMTAERPGIPEAYRDLSFGMTRAEVEAKHPELSEDIIRLKDHSDVFFHLDFGRRDEQLERMYFSMPDKRAHQLCQDAWGPGIPMSKDDHGPLRWFNTTDGLRATLSPGFGGEWDIELTAYVPFERLLGSFGRRFAFITGGSLLDQSAEALRMTYDVNYVEVDAVSAGQKHEMVGIEASAQAHSYLHLPPTEWTELETRVRVHFHEGVVDSYSFSLSYAPHPAARGAILEFFERKLGPPEQTTDLLGDPVYRYPGEPAVELHDDEISGAWDVRVSH